MAPTEKLNIERDDDKGKGHFESKEIASELEFEVPLVRNRFKAPSEEGVEVQSESKDISLGTEFVNATQLSEEEVLNREDDISNQQSMHDSWANLAEKIDGDDDFLAFCEHLI